jgi:hypothetical protein
MSYSPLTQLRQVCGQAPGEPGRGNAHDGILSAS